MFSLLVFSGCTVRPTRATHRRTERTNILESPIVRCLLQIILSVIQVTCTGKYTSMFSKYTSMFSYHHFFTSSCTSLVVQSTTHQGTHHQPLLVRQTFLSRVSQEAMHPVCTTARSCSVSHRPQCIQSWRTSVVDVSHSTATHKAFKNKINKMSFLKTKCVFAATCASHLSGLHSGDARAGNGAVATSQVVGRFLL